MNEVLLVAVPSGVVTVIGPLLAFAGTVALIRVAETTAYFMEIPLSRTAVAPLKFVPTIVTSVLAAPLAGEKLLIVGANDTLNDPVEVAVPAAVTTEIGPLVAPVGTTARICVDESCVKPAFSPLNRTALAALSPEPLIVTCVPIAPTVGVKLVTTGVTVKVGPVAVPAGVTTTTGPLVPLAGTVAVIRVEDALANEALAPLNRTLVAPLRPAPVMVTDVPVTPLAGAIPEIEGRTVKLGALVVVPPGVVTATGPVVAAVAKVARIEVSETIVKAAAAPPSVTLVALAKPEPLIVTSVPAVPLDGVKDEICAAAGGGTVVTVTRYWPTLP
jgi:hypothetical protein